MGHLPQTYPAKDLMMIYLHIFKKEGISMKRSAFTMIELVVVIVVLGILATVALPRLDRDIRQEAADSLLSNIRYTQHLAQMDNKQMFDDNRWQQRYWKIMFGTCSGSDRFFMIGSDSDMNNGSFFDRNESAIDASTQLPMFWSNGTPCADGGDGTVSNELFLSKKYGINGFTFAGGCAGTQYIGFDNMGRPHIGFGGSATPNHSSYMASDCTITFNFTDTSITAVNITILKETGYAQIVGQPDS